MSQLLHHHHDNDNKAATNARAIPQVFSKNSQAKKSGEQNYEHS